MANGLIIVARYVGGVYQHYGDRDTVLSPLGICKALTSHDAKGDPPLILVKDERREKDNGEALPATK